MSSPAVMMVRKCVEAGGGGSAVAMPTVGSLMIDGLKPVVDEGEIPLPDEVVVAQAPLIKPVNTDEPPAPEKLGTHVRSYDWWFDGLLTGATEAINVEVIRYYDNLRHFYDTKSGFALVPFDPAAPIKVNVPNVREYNGPAVLLYLHGRPPRYAIYRFNQKTGMRSKVPMARLQRRIREGFEKALKMAAQKRNGKYQLMISHNDKYLKTILEDGTVVPVEVEVRKHLFLIPLVNDDDRILQDYDTIDAFMKGFPAVFDPEMEARAAGFNYQLCFFEDALMKIKRDTRALPTMDYDDLRLVLANSNQYVGDTKELGLKYLQMIEREEKRRR